MEKIKKMYVVKREHIYDIATYDCDEYEYIVSVLEDKICSVEGKRLEKHMGYIAGGYELSELDGIAEEEFTKFLNGEPYEKITVKSLNLGE